ncbi:hypothetical protein CP981_06410 [Streptomyces platensis]|uniref:Uncharacterized protein n=1 Tax=Streptomyces platensis TaxID=58346 RepID=A0AAE6NEA9_STRPT|nr:hypothetical protein CP981_06410 [Streptomyces platensis]
MSRTGNRHGRASRRDDPRALIRRDTVLIIAVHMDDVPGASFRAGPLERRWRVGRPDEVVSSASRRVAYTQRHLEPLLWGQHVRWHREVPQAEASPSRFQLSAIELVRLNDTALSALKDMDSPVHANGVALLHGVLPSDPPAQLPKTLQECADVDPHHGQGAQRAWVARQLPSGCRIADTEREAVHCTLVTAQSGLVRLHPGRAQRNWDSLDQWLWHLHHATLYPPGPEAAEQLHAMRLPLPTKVRGVLGIRGLTLVGTEQDPGVGVPRNYYDGTSYHLATLYADALALARLQQTVLDAFGSEVARIGEHEPRRRKVAQMERDLLVFRRSYWAAGFGRQGTVDAMVRAWQQSAGLPQSLQSLVSDLGELSRQVQSAETETTNAILGLLAAVGLPLTTGLAIWQGLPQAGSSSLFRILGATGVVTVGLVTLFPGLRRLFVDLFRRKWRGGRR